MPLSPSPASVKTGLAPLLCTSPRILVLGSLPSDQSISRQEYYGNPKNRFWAVLAGVFGDDVPVDYPAKKAFLARHNVALWDTMASARREGSLDKDIREEVLNDIPGLLAACPSIRSIAINGGKAAKAFGRIRRMDPRAFDGLSIHYLTSTSSLSQAAGWSLARTVEQWREIL